MGKPVSIHQAELAWSLSIRAQSRRARDVDNVLGVSGQAAAGWDRLDRPEPPTIGEYVSIYFPHSDWDRPLKTYRADIRPDLQTGEVWDLELRTNIRDKVTLTFAGLETVPEELEIWLVDKVLDLSVPLREQRTYQVADATRPRPLQVIVGTAAFAADHGISRTLPTRFALVQNAPNPFNPATTIRYSLPQASPVSLRVYDALGQEIARLADSQSQPAGQHVAIWNGRDQTGRPAANGLYFYRLEAGRFSAVKKMLLLK